MFTIPTGSKKILKNSMSHYVPRPLWSLKVAIWENKPQIQIKGTEKKGSVLHSEHYLNKILVHAHQYVPEHVYEDCMYL